MTRALAFLLTLCVLALAACGDDDTEATPAGAPTAGFPVTVAQKLGEVTIERQPKRVVTLDFPSTDAALALGVLPVGIYEVSYVKGGIQEWTKAALRGREPELIDTERGFPLEQIAKLRPDVILATNTYPLIAESWDKLNRIAPVVGHVEGAGVDTWQQGVRQIGKALGRGERAERLISAAERKVTRARDANPQFGGKTVSIFNYVAGDGLYVIDDDADVSIKFFEELGFAGVPKAVASLSGTGGRAKVSPERYRTLDADVVLGTSPAPKQLEALERDKLFARVRGGFLGLDIGQSTAMAFPSVLSVPYAVDRFTPLLSKALAAR